MLKRSDLVTTAATLCGAGLTYFIKGWGWAIGCLLAGAAILLMLHFLNRKTGVLTTPAGTTINFSPIITQNANPVISQAANSAANTSHTSSQASEAKPNLEVFGRPGIMPVGYDMYGVWRVGKGENNGIILGIRNAAAKPGDRSGPANDLAASLEFRSPDGLLIGLVARAHWLGEEGNQIDLRSGETATILLAVIEGGHLLTFENPCNNPPVYYTRRPIPRTRPNYRGHPIPLRSDIKISIKLIDCEEGDTLFGHEILVTKAMGDIEFA